MQINNSSEVWLLKKRREVTKQNLIESEQSTKNLILQLAEQTRQLIELDGLSIPIDHISSYLADEMREAGWSDGKIDYMRHVLPPEYKNQDLSRFGGHMSADSVYDRTDDLIDNLTEDIVDKLPDSSVKIVYQKVKEKMSEQTRRYRMKVAMIIDKAAKRHIILEHEDKIMGEHYLTAEDNEWSYKTDKIAVILESCTRIHTKIAEKAKEAPPQDPQRMAELINDISVPEMYFMLHKNWYTPIGDEKWSFDLYTWGKIIYNCTEQGKHAAAKSKNLAKIPLTVYGINENRGLTREQVGDRFQFVFDRWVQMAQTIQTIMKHDPDTTLETYAALTAKGYSKEDLEQTFQKLFDSTTSKMQNNPLFRHFITIGEKWHYPEQSPMIAHRKYRLHDKLSELA